MDVARLKRRLKSLLENPSDLTELGRLARDLGHSLPGASLQEIREFRAQSAAVRDDLPESSSGTFAKGLLFGLVEMTAAYDAEMQAATERDELKRFIGQEIPLGILRQLGEGSRLPGDLARALSTSDAQISRALRDLRALGLVDLVSPAALGDQRTRPHRLTPEGRALLQTLKGSSGKSEVTGKVRKSSPPAAQEEVEAADGRRSSPTSSDTASPARAARGTGR